MCIHQHFIAIINGEKLCDSYWWTSPQTTNEILIQIRYLLAARSLMLSRYILCDLLAFGPNIPFRLGLLFSSWWPRVMEENGCAIVLWHWLPINYAVEKDVNDELIFTALLLFRNIVIGMDILPLTFSVISWCARWLLQFHVFDPRPPCYESLCVRARIHLSRRPFES